MHWMNVEVLTVFGAFATSAMTPHTENYSISVKRKVVVHTMVSVGYAELQAHTAACLGLARLRMWPPGPLRAGYLARRERTRRRIAVSCSECLTLTSREHEPDPASAGI